MILVPAGSTPVRVPPGLRVADRAGDALQLVANVQPLAEPAEPAAAAAVARAEQAFTFALLRQLNASGKPQNTVVSPSSLAIALSMLQNGAVGDTERGIAAALQTPGLSTAQQDAGWSQLSAELAAAGKQAGIAVDSANSLWLQRDLPMQAPFMTAMARYFQSGVWQVDFQSNLAAAAKAINTWAAKQTHGKITKLFDDGDIDQSTALVLAIAVYFKATWQTKFDPRLTTSGDFHLVGGGTATVPFLTTGPEGMKVPSAVTPSYDAVQLPYSGGRFAALAIMPKGTDLTSFVNSMTATRLQQITAGLTNQYPVDLRMPKLNLQQYTNLNTTMAAMGMAQAFSPLADFSAMSRTALQVQSVVQRDYLRVDEAGTEAAAVTGISAVPVALPVTRPIALDHPFLFLIRDTTTGTIIFAAQIQHP
ncbi:MAG: serpin family protein [Pseudonocardia sp.]|nr:serpin family protein [Pseudonocardia sp.]